MVFQTNPFPKSIYDNVAYGPSIHGLATGKIELDQIVESLIATAKVEKLIAELQQQFSIVIVTHAMQQAARISQRTA